MIDVLQVFEDKASNARVLIEHGRATIFVRVGGLRAFDSNIVEVWFGEFGNFGLKDVNDVFVEYGYGVRPSHWKHRQTFRSVGRLEGGEVAGARH